MRENRGVRALWVLAACCALAGTGVVAQEADPLRVVGVYPLPGAVVGSEVVFYFSEDIAAASKALPPWADEAGDAFYQSAAYEWGANYVRIYPKASGGFPRTQPYHGLRLRPDIEGISGARLPQSALEHNFVFRLPIPQRVELISDGTDKPSLILRFFDPVTAASLKEKLQVIVDGKLHTDVDVRQADEMGIVFRVALPVDSARDIFYEIQAGFADASGHAVLQTPYRSVVPIRALTLQSATWMGNSFDRLQLRFSDAVNATALTDVLRLENEAGGTLPYEIQDPGTGTNHFIVLQDSIPAEGELVVKVPAGLVSANQSILKSDVESRLRRPVRSFGVRYHNWENRGVDGPVLAVNLEQNVDVAEARKYLRIEPEIENLEIHPGDYGGRIEIGGAWRTGEVYTLVLGQGMPALNESFVVAQDMPVTLQQVPEYKTAAFSDDGKIYFPQRASGQLKVRARNTGEATIEVSEVFANNLGPALGAVQTDLMYSGFSDQWSRPIATKTLNFADAQDVTQEQGVDLRELLSGRKRGVYSLRLTPSADYQDTKIVLWTDLGVLAHWQEDALLVFVHDLYSLDAVANAKVLVYSHKNQLLGTVTSNGEGIARLDNFDTGLGEARLVVVETDSDTTFLSLVARYEDDTPFDGAMARFDRDGYDAFLYADRGIYRPGETVHARWLVRTNYGDAVPQVPFQARLWSPNGTKVFESPVTTSAVGSGGMDIETKESYLTGKYSLELVVPGGEAIGRYEFNVEEFVPNRIEAEVTVPEASFQSGTPHAIAVEARHLFGAPASGRKTELQVLLQPADFKPAGLTGYHFGNDAPFATVVENLGQQVTNDEGQAEFSFNYQPKTALTTPLNALVRAQVFEVGGRAVVASEERLLLPGDAMLGLRVAEAGERKISVDVAAVLADASPASIDTVEVVLERRTWSYYVRRMASHNAPGWTEQYEALETRELSLVDGKGTAEFQYPRYGYYRVRVRADATPQFSTQNFCAYWYGPRLISEPDPSLITLRMDKETYAPGDEAVLSIESPFDGRGIAVLQGDRFDLAAPVTIAQGRGELRITIPRGYAPNMWAEVTVIHGAETGSGEVYPYSSFAVVNVPVREAERILQVALPELPESTRPAQEQTVRIETRDHAGAPVAAEVTLAAVDDGIHNILGYETPDPAGWFGRSRMPDYRRAHYYDKVAYDFEAPAIGGDLLRKRLGKDENIGDNWIKPVALWAGTFHTGADGAAEVTLDLPEFNGRLRLVAVAATESATGAVEKKLLVRRPYMLRTTMPRFVLPGDQFTCRAVIFNTTDAAVQARIRCTSSTALLGGPAERTLQLPASGEATVSFDFIADNLVGQGALDWQVEVLDADGSVLESLAEHAPIPVNQPSSYRSSHELVTLAPGASQTFQNTEYLDAPPVDARISVGASLTLQLEDALRYLTGYPYGCIEQTLSRCLPTYLLRQDAALLRRSLGEERQLDIYLQAGIDRLFSMQVSDGGLSYWPGGGEAYPYGSVYGLHFLTLVRDAEALEVPEQGFGALQSYVRGLAAGGGGNVTPFHRAYACYVLSLGDDLQGIELIERLDAVSMPRAGRYLLAAALARQTDDRARVLNYLATAPMTPFYLRETAGSLHSEPRNKALEFLALLEMDEPVENLHAQAEELLRFVKDRPHRNTQDTAFLVSALGLYMQRMAYDAAAVSGSVEGPNGTEAVDGTSVFAEKRKGADAVYTVRNTGAAALYVDWTTAGVPKQPERNAVAEGIAITRVATRAGGGAVEEGAFRHGDSYVLSLSITPETLQHNIVVADLLPAGFEIENPRLDQDAMTAMGVENTINPSYLEVRDDRLVLAFDRLEKGTHTYHYVVRAITAGTFAYPSATVECMYDPTVRGVSAPAAITIR